MELTEDKGKVVRYFLKNTPVGEHREVVKDLEKIIGEEAVRSEVFADYLAEHLSDHGTSINHEGTSLMLTTIGRNGLTYFDPKVSATFDINPYTEAVSNLNPVESGTSFSRLLQGKLDQYLQAHFSETVQGRVFQNEEEVYIFISCPSVNLRNMWTGEWIGDWKFINGNLEGKVEFHAHYFEEGNLKCAQSKEVKKSISASSEEQGAEEIIKTIKEADNQIQLGLQDLYENVPSIVFKKMRRAMPVTKQKFSDMHRMKMFS
jgi:hypothetical protein